MKPINFKQSNKVLGKPKNWNEKKPCASLPVNTYDGNCISCWKLSIKERMSILFFGKIWLWVKSGKTQPPVALEAKKDIFKK